MNLDSLTPSSSTEPLSTRYWRRYGAEAINLLEKIRENPKQAKLLIQGTEYTHCELQQAAHREMITTLDDFLRRRSKIALVASNEAIKESAGLLEACEILFGDKAQEKFSEYFQSLPPVEKVTDSAHAEDTHSKALK
jgi:glycerol-3-phosphate dehydrogenase